MLRSPPSEVGLALSMRPWIKNRSSGLGHWQACSLRCHHLSVRSRWCEPCSVRLLRRLGWRCQCGRGSKTEVLDWDTGKLVPCDATTCPYAVDGVNHAPFASFGGWAGAVNAAVDQKQKDAAYAFFSYMAQPAQSNADVVVGKTGYNPFRISQFEKKQAWIDAGFSQAAADQYLSGIEESLNSPNMAADLRIPKNHEYIQVELDLSLIHIS